MYKELDWQESLHEVEKGKNNLTYDVFYKKSSCLKEALQPIHKSWK